MTERILRRFYAEPLPERALIFSSPHASHMVSEERTGDSMVQWRCCSSTHLWDCQCDPGHASLVFSPVLPETALPLSALGWLYLVLGVLFIVVGAFYFWKPWARNALAGARLGALLPGWSLVAAFGG